jgi:hypothetical protein
MLDVLIPLQLFHSVLWRCVDEFLVQNFARSSISGIPLSGPLSDIAFDVLLAMRDFANENPR